MNFSNTTQRPSPDFSYAESAPSEPTSECLFVGGPLDGKILSVPDNTSVAFVNGDPNALVSSLMTGIADYQRYNEANVFAHVSASSDQVESRINAQEANTARIEAEEAFDDETDEGVAYLLGMRDIIDLMLEKAGYCPDCGEAFA